MKLLVFSAEWCQPCKRLHGFLNRYLEEHPTLKGKLVEFDIERDADLSVAEGFKVMSIPTMIIVEDNEAGFGIEVDRHSGTITLPSFEKFIAGL